MNTILEAEEQKTQAVGKNFDQNAGIASRPVCLILDEVDGALESNGISLVAQYLKQRIELLDKQVSKKEGDDEDEEEE